MHGVVAQGSMEQSAVGTEPPRDTQRRILIFDEHEGSCLVTHYALTALGHVSKAVSTLAAMFALLPTFRPDLVIYEWKVQRGEAIGLAARLRETLGAITVVPAIVVLSTQDEPAGFREQEQIDAYFTKPFHAADLSAIVSIRA